MWNLKTHTNECIYKTERQQTYSYQRGGGGINYEYGGNRHTLLYIKQGLLCSTRNYIQYLVITYNGKGSEKAIYICVCVYVITESLCCISETNTIL